MRHAKQIMNSKALHWDFIDLTLKDTEASTVFSEIQAQLGNVTDGLKVSGTHKIVPLGSAECYRFLDWKWTGNKRQTHTSIHWDETETQSGSRKTLTGIS